MLLLRPHVVTVQWLLDSFNKGSLLPEASYLHPDCVPPSPAAVSVSARRTPSSRHSDGPPAASPSTPMQTRAEEDMLSQYMNDDPTFGKYLILQDLLLYMKAQFIFLVSSSGHAPTSRGQQQEVRPYICCPTVGARPHQRTRARLHPAGSQRGGPVFWETLPTRGLWRRGRDPALHAGDREWRHGPDGPDACCGRLRRGPTVGLCSGGHSGRGGH